MMGLVVSSFQSLKALFEPKVVRRMTKVSGNVTPSREESKGMFIVLNINCTIATFFLGAVLTVYLLTRRKSS
jgi:hypothetical protein